ncbi:MAG: hypothetical protein Q8O89_02595 [Nanoarchaeota archaeon]|nr:hypothetical protein [Nanoarchaeota archaeon]
MEGDSVYKRSFKSEGKLEAAIFVLIICSLVFLAGLLIYNLIKLIRQSGINAGLIFPLIVVVLIIAFLGYLTKWVLDRLLDYLSSGLSVSERGIALISRNKTDLVPWSEISNLYERVGVMAGWDPKIIKKQSFSQMYRLGIFSENKGKSVFIMTNGGEIRYTIPEAIFSEHYDEIKNKIMKYKKIE